MPKRSRRRGRSRIEWTRPSPLITKLEAIWLDGPAPVGYWSRPENRLRYMRWLGQKLGFQKLEDWYRISTDDFKRNRGGGLLAAYFDSSAVVAVQQSFPEHDWKEWLFTFAPRRFWHNAENHRRYMDWLGEQLAIRRPEDWYRVSVEDFLAHKGGAFLLHYHSAPSAAIKAYLPRYAWKEWLFTTSPKRFWDSKQNRRRYMRWLGDQLGCQKPQDWYAVKQSDFRAHHGGEFLKYFDSSPAAAIKEYLPRFRWEEWRFDRVPAGFWDVAKNRRRYLTWLVNQLGLKSPREWKKIRAKDLRSNYGAGLLARYDSYRDAVAELLPAPSHNNR